MYEVKKISLEELLPLRAKVLRHGKRPEEVIFAGDNADTTFHLGTFSEDMLITVGSFYKENLDGQIGDGYRLRSMASLPDMQSKGAGSVLMQYAIAKLKRMKIDYLWCNARTGAVGFYQKMGLKIISDEFSIPEIGPHYVMITKLND